MGIFTSSDEVYSVLTPFYQSLTTDPDIGPKFVSANTSFRLRHVDPECTFMLDTTVDPPKLLVAADADGAEPEVELAMSSDDGHAFWLGKLNLPIALAKRKVKVTGPVTKLLGLLPALQPAYAKYRSHLEDIGRQDLASRTS